MGNMEFKAAAPVQEEMRAYEAPTIRVMDEQEVLSAFQVTVAAITWWGM